MWAIQRYADASERELLRYTVYDLDTIVSEKYMWIEYRMGKKHFAALILSLQSGNFVIFFYLMNWWKFLFSKVWLMEFYILAAHLRLRSHTIYHNFINYYAAFANKLVLERRCPRRQGRPPRDSNLGLRPQTERWIILILHFLEKCTFKLHTTKAEVHLHRIFLIL